MFLIGLAPCGADAAGDFGGSVFVFVVFVVVGVGIVIVAIAIILPPASASGRRVEELHDVLLVAVDQLPDFSRVGVIDQVQNGIPFDFIIEGFSENISSHFGRFFVHQRRPSPAKTSCNQATSMRWVLCK